MIPLRREHDLRRLTQHLHEHMSRYGYKITEVPVIEVADLFLIKAGDQVVNKLFTFDRHGQQFALRPEFTASAAFRYLQLNTDTVVRWQFSGAVFEDDPNDAGRSYQRMSIGAELIGMAGAPADAEIIGMAAQGLADQGIQEWRVAIGHIRLLRLVLAQFGLDSRIERFILHVIPALRDPLKGRPYVLEQVEKLLTRSAPPDVLAEADGQPMLDAMLDLTAQGATLGGRTQYDIARRLLQKRRRALERGQIVAALDALERWCAVSLSPAEAFAAMRTLTDDSAIHRTLDDWERMVRLLDAYEIDAGRILIQPGLVRSWEYYTGMVFDLMLRDLSLGGGGRYDELIRLIGGQHDVPAVGFTYYVDQVSAALPALSEQHPPPLIVGVTPENAEAATRLAFQLRQHGLAACLLPDENAGMTPLISVDDQGYATYNGRVYPPSEIELLISALKRAEP